MRLRCKEEEKHQTNRQANALKPGRWNSLPKRGPWNEGVQGNAQVGQITGKLLQKNLRINSFRGCVWHLRSKFFQPLGWRRKSSPWPQLWTRKLEGKRKAQRPLNWYRVLRVGRYRRELNSGSLKKRAS